MQAAGDLETSGGIVSTPTVQWSSRASRLTSQYVPLPGTREFADQVRGRAGDVVVVQVRSEASADRVTRECLKTLNLRGVNTMSLRHSEDPTFWGLVASVRDYVAVYPLGGVFYKQSSSSNSSIDTLTYEHLSYGTNTKPGELVRDSEGHFFAYESDPQSLLLMWDTNLSIVQTIKQFVQAHPRAVPSTDQEASVVGLSSEIEQWEGVDVFTSNGASVVDGPTPNCLAIVHDQHEAVSYARLQYGNLALNWKSPRKHFEDRGNVSAVTGLWSTDMDLPAARSFAEATGGNLIADADLNVEVRSKGVLKNFRF